MPEHRIREARRKDGQQMGGYLPQNHLDDLQEMPFHHEFLKGKDNIRLRLRLIMAGSSPLPFFIIT
jgi:hypothetical protein